MSSVVVGIIAGSIVALISFILGLFGNMWYGNFQEKKKIRNQSLRNHFRDLETSVIEPMSELIGGIINSEGTLSIIKGGSGHNPSHLWPTKDFEEGNFHIFKLHFRSQANVATKLMNEIDNHNERVVSFHNKLKKNIEEKTGLPFRGKGMPFIEDEVPTYLQQTLYHLAVSKLGADERGTTYYDFREAKIERIKEAWDAWLVTTKEPGATYAKVTTIEEATSFKDGLIGLMESVPLLDKMSDIYLEAKRLGNEASALAGLLDFEWQQYDKYGKLLKKEGGCPVCQVIFG